MKIQPIDANGAAAFAGSLRDPAKPPAKSRLKRLFDRRQLPSLLRSSSAEKVAAAGDGSEVEPSSVLLDTMVFGFIEEGANHEKPPRGRCNCFNANFDDSSDDDFDAPHDADAQGSAADAADTMKGLVLCASVEERNLLADASRILDKGKNSKNKGDCRMTVAEGLRSLGYDAAICKSKWDKNPSFPAGEYEYVDVVVDGGERLLVDVDFRSEFEVARPAKSYRAVLQHLPQVFVGRPDRLQLIVTVASEAARLSLKKKGLHVAPWRRPEYIKAKWLSPYQRTTALDDERAKEEWSSDSGGAKKNSGGLLLPCSISAVNFSVAAEESAEAAAADERIEVAVSAWHPPPARPKPGVAGLALVL